MRGTPRVRSEASGRKRRQRGGPATARERRSARRGASPRCADPNSTAHFDCHNQKSKGRASQCLLKPPFMKPPVPAKKKSNFPRSRKNGRGSGHKKPPGRRWPSSSRLRCRRRSPTRRAAQPPPSDVAAPTRTADRRHSVDRRRPLRTRRRSSLKTCTASWSSPSARC